MNYFKFLLFFLLMILLVNCSNEPKKTIESVTPQEKTESSKKKLKKEVVVEKPWDSLTRKNVVQFFTEYGKQNTENKVKITTKYGQITVLLYEDTPLHRANFIFLTKIGYFDTTMFYRVLEDFVIQGGNSEKLAMTQIRNKYKNYRLPSEFRTNRKHKYGALASARRWQSNPDKKSTPFEFYIIQGRQGAFHLDNEHTVFGEVISGFNTIDKIAKLETGIDEWPFEDVFMKAEVIN